MSRERKKTSVPLFALEKSKALRKGIKMLEAWFDGCCEPTNPGGNAAWGAVLLRDGKKIWEDAEYCGFGSKMSNNVAEYSGVAAILERLQKEEEPCLIRGDSKLVIMQLQRKWKINGGLYTPFWQRAKVLYEPIRDRVTFEWVPRDENAICDALSKGVLHDRGIRFRIQPLTLLDFKPESGQLSQAAKSNAAAPAQTSGAPNAVQKPARTKILEEGEPCRHCSTPVVRRTHTKPPKHKAGGYYFSYWFQCPKCKALYMVESAKKFFDNEIDERFQQALELDGS